METKDWEKLVQSLTNEGMLRTSNVIRAMRLIPRGQFLQPNMQAYSAVDTPLPIGFGQTISAPHSFDF